MTEKKTYDSDQIKDAKKLADVLISVKGESRRYSPLWSNLC